MRAVEDGEGLPGSGQGDIEQTPFFFPRFFRRFCLPVPIENENVRVFHALGAVDRREQHSLPEAVLPAAFGEALIDPFDHLRRREVRRQPSRPPTLKGVPGGAPTRDS